MSTPFDPNRPEVGGDPAVPAEPTDEATDVRGMLDGHARSITPRSEFADLERRISEADGSRRRNRTLLTAAAAVVLVVLVAGLASLASRDDEGTQRVDVLDSSTSTQPPTTEKAEGTTSTEPPGTTTSEVEAADGTTTSVAQGTSPSTDAEPPGIIPITEDTPVRIDGIGPISVPVLVEEAAALTGQPIAIDPNSIIDESNACRFAQDPSLPGIWYMVDRDRIVRVDITGQGTPNRTEAGVGVGSTIAEIEAAYPGRVTQEPHPYPMDDASRNVVVTDPVYPMNTMVFSVHQGAVVDYRVGLADWVAMPEGCA